MGFLMSLTAAVLNRCRSLIRSVIRSSCPRPRRPAQRSHGSVAATMPWRTIPLLCLWAADFLSGHRGSKDLVFFVFFCFFLFFFSFFLVFFCSLLVLIVLLRL